MNVSSEDLASQGTIITSISKCVEMRYRQINIEDKRVNSGASHGIISRQQEEKKSGVQVT